MRSDISNVNDIGCKVSESQIKTEIFLMVAEAKIRILVFHVTRQGSWGRKESR